MKLLKSFGYAFKGLKISWQQRNFRLHLLAMFLVLLMGFGLSISRLEWLLIWLCVGTVISAEIFNTGLEKIATFISTLSPQAYQKMGEPKDLGAGAVLIASLVSALVGTAIFGPYILEIIF